MKTFEEDQPELTPTEHALGVKLAGAKLVHWENMHYQYENGFVDEEHWQTQLSTMEALMPVSIFRSHYEDNKKVWRKSFRSVLDQILSKR